MTKFSHYLGLVIVLVTCFNGFVAGLTLQKLALANPFSITPNQLATFTPNVRSEVMGLITSSIASGQALPSYTSLINANGPLVAASSLNILPGTGYMTALSPLRSKIVQVRKPALINPYPVAPFPYITAADVAHAQLLTPSATIPQIQQARIDSRKKNHTSTAVDPAHQATVQQPSTTTQQGYATQQTYAAQQPYAGATSQFQVRPVDQNSGQSGQIASIIQNALQMAQNNPEFMRSLQINNPAAFGSASSLNDQLMNGLQISLYHGPQSDYTPGNMANHQTLVLQPQDHNFQVISSTGDHDGNHQYASNSISPNYQSLSTNGY